MTDTEGEGPARELDPLSTSAFATVATGTASLVWPGLVAAAVTLAALATFVVWGRALQALRRRRVNGYDPVRLVPLLLLGGAGWTAALFLGSVLPLSRPLVLCGVGLGLWALARPALEGV